MLSENQKKELFEDNLNRYCDIPVFQQAHGDELYIKNDPFRRPLRSNDNPFINFYRPLKKHELVSNSSLAANRILLNIYEQDMQFLPYKHTDQHWESYHQLYSDEAVSMGES